MPGKRLLPCLPTLYQHQETIRNYSLVYVEVVIFIFWLWIKNCSISARRNSLDCLQPDVEREGKRKWAVDWWWHSLKVRQSVLQWKRLLLQTRASKTSDNFKICREAKFNTMHPPLNIHILNGFFISLVGFVGLVFQLFKWFLI